jgi:probable HAF family extracellular repeat protein
MNGVARITVVVVFSLANASCAFADPSYHVTYLGFAFTNGIEAKINNLGQIAGNDSNNGFIYDAGRFTILGNTIRPMAINDSGQVAGFGRFNGHDAFFYANGSLVDLGVLPGNANSDAFGINASGDVVGSSALGSGGSPRAFLYHGGNLIDLGSGFANAINSTGDIVGKSENLRAVRYANGAMIDLGNFGDRQQTSAIDINDSGQIVGNSFVLASASPGTYVSHAFLYEAGVWRDLGLPAGVPLAIPSAINNAGQVVGNSNESLGAFNRPPFLYTDGTNYNLQSLLDDSGVGLNLELAYDINDSGVILAEGYASNASYSGYQAVLLTPVPEPSSLVSAGIAAAMVICSRGRRGCAD